jgi:hypothetical protein
MNKNSTLDQETQKIFLDWLELNLNNISWEGRYINEFNNFWSKLFPNDIEYSVQLKKLRYAIQNVKSGPLVSWFVWLEEKLISYLFIYKNLSIEELANCAEKTPSDIALILRTFFVERFPHLEEKLNEMFQITHVTCANLKMSFNDFSLECKIDNNLRGSLEDDVLKNLEVTLYDDWVNFSQLILDDNKNDFKILNKISHNLSFQKQLKFFQELIILFIIGGVLIFAVKIGNQKYEEYLVKKITLFEPNFFWLDKNLTFQAENPLDKKEIELSYRELEKLEQLESSKIFEDEELTARFDGESDVVLTSIDALPKDFDLANLEQSSYEEYQKGGFRNLNYGRRKAYRVMMSSVNPITTRDTLIDVLSKFNVQQVDNVVPGKEIPGGMYFNIYVPQNVIQEFLSYVSSVEETTILESRTVQGGPPGTDKVFIWIKSI